MAPPTCRARGGLPDLLVCLFLLTWASSDAADLKIVGEMIRVAFEGNRQQFLNQTSTISIAINGESRVFQWHDSQRDWQYFWIKNSGDQRGLEVFSGFSNGTNFRATNGVVATDVQPRGASQEIRMMALSLFDSNLLATAIQRGFIVPWGDEDRVDRMFCQLQPRFHSEPPYSLAECDITLSETHASLPWKPGTSAERKAGAHEMLARFYVDDWWKSDDSTIPARWTFERYASEKGSRYMLERTTFRALSISPLPAGSCEQPTIPASCGVSDYRASSKSDRGLYVSYVTSAPGTLMDPGEKTYQDLAEATSRSRSQARLGGFWRHTWTLPAVGLLLVTFLVAIRFARKQ